MLWSGMVIVSPGTILPSFILGTVTIDMWQAWQLMKFFAMRYSLPVRHSGVPWKLLRFSWQPMQASLLLNNADLLPSSGTGWCTGVGHFASSGTRSVV